MLKKEDFIHATCQYANAFSLFYFLASSMRCCCVMYLLPLLFSHVHAYRTSPTTSIIPG